jgi:hypothetical protein
METTKFNSFITADGLIISFGKVIERKAIIGESFSYNPETSWTSFGKNNGRGEPLTVRLEGFQNEKGLTYTAATGMENHIRKLGNEVLSEEKKSELATLLGRKTIAVYVEAPEGKVFREYFTSELDNQKSGFKAAKGSAVINRAGKHKASNIVMLQALLADVEENEDLRKKQISLKINELLNQSGWQLESLQKTEAELAKEAADIAAKNEILAQLRAKLAQPEGEK